MIRFHTPNTELYLNTSSSSIASTRERSSSSSLFAPRTRISRTNTQRQTNKSQPSHSRYLVRIVCSSPPHSNHRHCIRTTCSSGRSDDDDDEEREYVECLRNTTPRVSSERSHDDEEREYDECLRNTTPSYTTANTPRISWEQSQTNNVSTRGGCQSSICGVDLYAPPPPPPHSTS